MLFTVNLKGISIVLSTLRVFEHKTTIKECRNEQKINFDDALIDVKSLNVSGDLKLRHKKKIFCTYKSGSNFAIEANFVNSS
jgi:hypothetical protein